MSSTFFTASPHWRWLIVAYFFFGGLAAGSYFLATLLDLFGKDRRLVRLGYLVAFPVVCLCRLSAPSPVGRVVTVIGTFLALYVAGYTGVLLAASNRPIWADTTLLGVTFLISAVSTSAALLILLGGWGGVTGDSIHALERF